MEEQLDYTIKLKEKRDDGCLYKIDVVIPMKYGWLDDLFYYVKSDNVLKSFKIPFDHNDEKNVHFSGDVFLETKAVYRTYFSFLGNQRRFYLTKDRQVVDFLDNNSLDKISVNFDTP